MKKNLRSQKMSVLAVSLVALILSACAGSSDGGGSNNGPDQKPKPEDVTPAGYYEELLSKPVGDCANIQDLQFQVLANLQNDKFGISDDRKDLVVHVLLSLKEDGTYLAIYSEEKVVKANNAEMIYENVFSKNIKGTWKVEGKTKLVLSGLGVANKYQLGDVKRVQLKIQQRIHDPRVNSLFITLDKTLTAIGPDGETVEQYCEN